MTNTKQAIDYMVSYGLEAQESTSGKSSMEIALIELTIRDALKTQEKLENGEVVMVPRLATCEMLNCLLRGTASPDKLDMAANYQAMISAQENDDE